MHPMRLGVTASCGRCGSRLQVTRASGTTAPSGHTGWNRVAGDEGAYDEATAGNASIRMDAPVHGGSAPLSVGANTIRQLGNVRLRLLAHSFVDFVLFTDSCFNSLQARRGCSPSSVTFVLCKSTFRRCGNFASDFMPSSEIGVVGNAERLAKWGSWQSREARIGR